MEKNNMNDLNGLEETPGITDKRTILEILDLFDKYDLTINLMWQVDLEKEELHLMVLCNDLFYWACADVEEITLENLPLLKQTIQDLIEMADKVISNTFMLFNGTSKREEHILKRTHEIEYLHYATDLFCCRSRKMRPQDAYYRNLPESISALFDACGPERNVCPPDCNDYTCVHNPLKMKKLSPQPGLFKKIWNWIRKE